LPFSPQSILFRHKKTASRGQQREEELRFCPSSFSQVRTAQRNQAQRNIRTERQEHHEVVHLQTQSQQILWRQKTVNQIVLGVSRPVRQESGGQERPNEEAIEIEYGRSYEV
jgi:hypothetical protein